MTDSFTYIALEYCLVSLQDEVKLNLLNMDAVTILKKCTKGIAHLHKNNIIHRDLKPANVLLNRGNQVKISDFGLSKQIPMGMSSVSLHSGVVGTADWTAPELLRYLYDGIETGQQIRMSKSADIFSLGCVYFFTLTKGSHPFGSGHARQYNMCNNKPQLQGCKLENKWLQLIQEMICDDPTRRPTTQDILRRNCFKSHTEFAKSSNQVASEEFNRENFSKPDNQAVNTNQETIKTPNSSGNSDDRTGEVSTANISNPEKPTDITENIANILSNTANVDIDSNNQAITSGTVGIWEKNSKGTWELTPESKTVQMQETPKSLMPNQKPFYHQVNPEILIRAVKQGHCVRDWIMLCPYWDIESEDGQTILHVAAEYGNVDALEYFTSCGVDIDAEDDYLNTPLLKVGLCEQNFIPTLDFFSSQKLKKEDPVNKDGDNLILLGCYAGRSDVELAQMVEMKFSWNIRNKKGLSVLHQAAEGGNLKALKYFIGLGADVHAVSGDQETPLHRARFATTNFIPIVEALVKNGARITATTNKNQTLVHMVESMGDTGKLKALEEYMRNSL